MDTHVQTPAQGMKLRLEQHDPEEQLTHALTRAGQWLYKRLRLKGVTRGDFIQALIDVIAEAEPQRFSRPTGTFTSPITFDGSQGELHVYLDRTFDVLGVAPRMLPRNCALWIYTNPSVVVLARSAERSSEVSIYPRFVPAERSDMRAKKFASESVESPGGSKWSLRIFIRTALARRRWLRA